MKHFSIFFTLLLLAFTGLSAEDTTAKADTPTCAPVEDCIHVTRDADGIFVIDCADILRVASQGYGIPTGEAEARMGCCIQILVDTDGSDPYRVTLTDPVHGVLQVAACQ